MLNAHLLRGGGVALLLAVAACGQGEGAAPADASAAPAAATTVRDPVTQTPTAPAAGAQTAASRHAPPAPARDQIAAARSPELTRCLESGDAANGVSAAMGRCFNAELRRQDGCLNAAYRTAMAALDAAGQARLRTEERAWIRRRDAGCAEAATGGSIDQVEIPGCLLDETIRRRLVLEAIAG